MVRILLVDDDEDLRFLLGDALANAGYRVTTSTEGAEALCAAKTERPDLIISDIVM